MSSLIPTGSRAAANVIASHCERCLTQVAKRRTWASAASKDAESHVQNQQNVGSASQRGGSSSSFSSHLVLPDLTPIGGVSFVPISIRDAPRVLDLLRRNFFRDEPINAALDMHDLSNGSLLEGYVHELLAAGLSVGAVSEQDGDELLGVVLNGVADASELDVPLSEQLAGIEGTKLADVLTLIRKVNEKGKEVLFAGGERQIFDMKILSTDRGLRRAGVATHMVRSAVEKAKEAGFSRVKCEATNVYSRRVAENVGLRWVSSVPYADYEVFGSDSDGGRRRRPFSHLARQHHGVVLMARDL